MVIIGFLLWDKLKKFRFFSGRHQNENDLGDAFSHLWQYRHMVCREGAFLENYSAAEALPMTRKVEIIDKKKFAAATLSKDDKTFECTWQPLVRKRIRIFILHEPRSLCWMSKMLPFPQIRWLYQRTPRRSYPSTPASTIILSAWYMVARQRSDIVHPQEGR